MGVSDFDAIKTILTGLDNNKVSKFAYTDSAFAADTVDGVTSFNVSAEQNVPTKDYTDVNTTVLNKGIRTQGASLPRMLINHFFGRVSYNLNKLVNKIVSFIQFFLATLAHNCNEYDASALYAVNDTCYVITSSGSDLVRTVYQRITSTPPTIQGIATSNTTHWKVVSNVGYGIGPNVKLIGTAIDMDTAFTGGGKYNSATITDSPAPGNWFFYDVIYSGAANKAVIAYTQDGSKVSFINIKTTTWSGWKKLSTSSSSLTALDADTVSAYGIGVAKNLASVNLDTVRLGTYGGGLYGVDSGCTNGPIGSTFGHLLVIEYAAGGTLQLYSIIGNDRMFKRTYNGTWNAWCEIWNSATDGLGSGLEADTVPGYGIGTIGSTTPADLDSILGGFSQFINTTLHRPALDIPTMQNYGICLTFPYNGGGQYPVQMAFDTSGNCAVRNKSTGSWSAWKSQWNAFNDGLGSGLEADTVPGYGIGTAATQITDIGTYGAAGGPSKSGLYQYNTPTGTTPVGVIGLLLHMSRDANYAVQLCQPFGSLSWYTRVKSSNVWNAWQKLWDAQNDGPGSGLDADTVSGAGVNGWAVLTTNLDTASPGIFYRHAPGTTGAPNAGSYGLGFCTGFDANASVQMEFDLSMGKVHRRNKQGGAWQPWQCLDDGLNAGVAPAPKPSANSPAYNANITIPAGQNTSSWYIATSGGASAVALPAISGVQAGTRITIKKYQSDANAITINRAGSDVIGGYSGTSFVLYAMEDYVVLESSGTSWYVVATNGPVKTNESTVVGTQTNPINAQVYNLGGSITIDPGVYEISFQGTCLVNGTSGILALYLGIGIDAVSFLQDLEFTIDLNQNNRALVTSGSMSARKLITATTTLYFNAALTGISLTSLSIGYSTRIGGIYAKRIG